jgi:uncharacterized protein YeaO (DUF488 family)
LPVIDFEGRDPEDRVVKAGNAVARREKMLDKTIADSFPASDPPSSLPDPSEDSFSWMEETLKVHEMILLKRAYEAASPDDGVRILVERLWPRGIRKERLKLDAWMKNVAPSDRLRRWFGHDPKKWTVFRERYFAELDLNDEAWHDLARIARDGKLTLIYSSHDTEHNNAVALKDYLVNKLSGRGGSKRIA